MMGWPVDKVYAQAPNYSFSGQVAWPGARDKFDLFMAACETYESAARASYNATVTSTWTADGTIHTGTAAPAVPATEYFTGPCGSGRRFTSTLVGGYGLTTTAVKFFAKKYKKEYRWVEEITPVASGTPCVRYQRDPRTTPGTYDSNNAYVIFNNTWNNLMDQIGGPLISGYHWIPINGTYGNTAAQVSNSLRLMIKQTLIDWMNTAYGAGNWYTPYYSWPDPTWIHTSSGFIAWTYNIYSSYYTVYSPGTASSPGVDGRWRREFRYVVDTAEPTACGQANYIQTAHPNFDFGEDPPKIISRHRFTTVQGTGLMRVNSICGSAGDDRWTTDIWDPSLTQQIVDSLNSPGYTLTGQYNEPVVTQFTTPGNNFLIQTGNAFVGYNEAKGALVYDLQLKKWGKFKQDHSLIIDYTPANIPTYGQFTSTDLGMTAGIWQDGYMRVFDDEPTEGFIRYGKIGYYRLGMIHFLETRLDFRRPFMGNVIVDASLDGRVIEPAVRLTTAVNGQNTVTIYPNMRYRWYTITIDGKFDLQYMETRANVSTRR